MKVTIELDREDIDRFTNFVNTTLDTLRKLVGQPHQSHTGYSAALINPLIEPDKWNAELQIELERIKTERDLKMAEIGMKREADRAKDMREDKKLEAVTGGLLTAAKVVGEAIGASAGNLPATEPSKAKKKRKRKSGRNDEPPTRDVPPTESPAYRKFEP